MTLGGRQMVGVWGIIILAGALVSTSVICSANPSPLPPVPDSTLYINDDALNILMIFLLNISVNLSLFSALFLIAASRDEEVGESVPLFRHGLATTIIAVIIVVTIVGALVDFALVTSVPTAPTSHTPPTADARMIRPDVLKWGLATGMIFLSLLAPSAWVLKIPKKRNVMISGTIALANPVWWLATWWIGSDVAIATLIMGLLLTPIMVKGLASWDRRRRNLPETGRTLPALLREADGGQSYRGAALSRLYDPPPDRGRGKA